jgi:DNA-binding XRE family transcriptional regulator
MRRHAAKWYIRAPFQVCHALIKKQARPPHRYWVGSNPVLSVKGVRVEIEVSVRTSHFLAELCQVSILPFDLRRIVPTILGMNTKNKAMPRAAKQHSVLHANFQRNLRSVRQLKGLTQQELADRLQINRTCIADFERGRNLPGLLLIERIAAALRIHPLSLLRRPDK